MRPSQIADGSLPIENLSICHLPSAIRNSIVIATTGVVIGLALVIWTWSRAASMSADGAHYMELARLAWRHGLAAGMDWYSGPGYPAPVSWLYGVVGDLEFAGRLTSLLFGCGFVIGVGLLARHMFGPVVAGATVGLVAVHTSLVRHAAMAETDVAYGCWLVWSVFFLWRLRHASSTPRRLLLAVATGLSLGIGYLTRPEAAALAGLLVTWHVGAAAPSRTSFRERLGSTLIIIATGLIVAAPYVLKLREELGRWSLSGKERCFAMKYAADKQDDSAIRDQGVVGALFERPSNLLRWLPHHVRYGVPVCGKSLHVVVLALAAVGLTRRRAVERSPGAVGLLLWASVPFLLFFGLTYPRPRYFMQALGPWSILAGVGAVELAACVGELRTRLAIRWRSTSPVAAGRRAWTMALGTPVLLVALSTWWSMRRPLEQGLVTERAVGERLLQLAGPGRRVLTFTVPAFYAHAERVPLWGPMEGIVRCHGFSKPLTYDELVDHVRRHGAEYVIMDYDLQRDCPGFLARAGDDDDFQLVISDVADGHGPHLVYRFVGSHSAATRAN
jgi:hypothetical protein